MKKLIVAIASLLVSSISPVAGECRSCSIGNGAVFPNSAVDLPEAWRKARMLRGVATRNGDDTWLGIFELKCGQANKQGIAKVSAKLTGLDGKKKSYQPKTVYMNGGTVVIVNFDGLSITIDGDMFYGDEGVDGGLSVKSANMGGALTDGNHTFELENSNLALPGELQEQLLPVRDKREVFTSTGGKWKFSKGASIKVREEPACCGMTPKTGVSADKSNGKTNLSSLKLSYTPKTGLFKGTFKAYTLESSRGKTKLAKYTINVTGLVIDGQGVGLATCKKSTGGPWAVRVD